MDKHIASALSARGVEGFGVCRFGDLPPLLPCRAMSRLPEGADSVIVVPFPYFTGHLEHRNVARYAVLPDYHRVALDILEALADVLAVRHPGHRFVPFVDNSPIPEVAAARLAGLGVVGLHRQLIHPAHGGHVLLGTVVTTLALEASQPEEKGCLGCSRCIAACPTAALSERGFVTGRCRSHITQKKGALTPWEEEQVRDGGLAWGCDICVDACPMNTWKPTPVGDFYHNPAPLLTPGNLAALMPEKPYGYRGRAVLERNLRLIGQDLGALPPAPERTALFRGR